MEEIKNSSSDLSAMRASDYVKNLMLLVRKMKESESDTEYQKALKALQNMSGNNYIAERAIELYDRNKDDILSGNVNWSTFAVENKSLTFRFSCNVDSILVKPEKKRKTVKKDKNTAVKSESARKKRQNHNAKLSESKAEDNSFVLVGQHTPILTESGLNISKNRLIAFKQLQSTEKKDRANFNAVKGFYHEMVADCKTVSDYIELMHNKAFKNVLDGLSVAVARSVLRKMYDPQRTTAKAKAEKAIDMKDAVTSSGCNENILKMYRNINISLEELQALCDAVEVEPDNLIINKTIAEGFNLVSASKLAIIDWSERQLTRHSSIDLDAPEEYTHINKRVIINDDPVFVTEERAPISFAFRRARQETINNGTLNIAPSHYVYTADLLTPDNDDDTAESEVVYRRAKANYLTVSEGDSFSLTTSAEQLERLHCMIEKLNLTKRQALVLNYLINGYGIKAIATKLNCSYQNIAKIRRAIEVKAVKADIFSQELLDTVGLVETVEQRKREIQLKFMENMKRRDEREKREREEERKERENNMKSVRYVKKGQTRQIYSGYYSLGLIEEIALNMYQVEGYSIETTMIYLQFAFSERMTEKAKNIIFKTLSSVKLPEIDLYPTIGKKLDKLVSDRAKNW